MTESEAIDFFIEKNNQQHKLPHFTFDKEASFKTGSVVMLQFSTNDPKSASSINLFKLKFAIVNMEGKSLLEFIFNSDFGLRILNNSKRDDQKRDFYLDIDLDFLKITK